jgi:hypothetical protein
MEEKNGKTVKHTHGVHYCVENLANVIVKKVA